MGEGREMIHEGERRIEELQRGRYKAQRERRERNEKMNKERRDEKPNPNHITQQGQRLRVTA